MVCATVGSGTSTGWKRRSSAASFSMCFWYSFSVVAPMRLQLAAGERRLERVGDVEPALAAALAGADDGVDLVDEQHHAVLLGRDLLEDLLDPLLELAAVLRAGHHGVDRQLDEALVAQRLRHLAGDDALGEALDDRGLADARLADQHRVVLLAPGQHLDRRLDLLRAADHRVELALARQGSVRSRGVFVEVRGVGRASRPGPPRRRGRPPCVTCWRIACGVSP